MKRVLVTGSGGVAGVNFVNALRIANEKIFVVGTDYDKYHIEFPDVDVRVRSPRHDDSSFVPLISSLVEKHEIDFVHPQPSVEAAVIAKNRQVISEKCYLPDWKVIARDKLETQKILEKKNIPVAKTKTIFNAKDIPKAFKSVGTKPVWVRAKSGAGGRLSLPCKSSSEIEHWTILWVIQNKAKWSDFMLQEFLPGRNIAWDSLWYRGELITSFCRERLAYPFKHISVSGITGTPSVSRIIVDGRVDRVGELAVKALDPKPHGSYSVDLKEDSDGKPRVTEVDAGKFHTTTPLWGYAAIKCLGMQWSANIPHLYGKLGTGEHVDKMTKHNLYPEDIYLLRHIDCGAWLWRENGWKKRIL
jgi:carbamoyl-phosphate synthase large subunit